MSKSSRKAFDLFSTHVLLGAMGEAEAGAIPAAYADAQKTEGWFFGAARIDRPARWWEVHPLGDEVLYVASGEVSVTLEEGETHRVINLRQGEACVVTRGTWHRVDATGVGELVFLTFQKETRNRPV